MKKHIVPILVIAIIALVIIIFVLIFNTRRIETPNTENPVEISSTIIIKDNVVQIQNSKRAIDAVIPEFQNLDNDYERYINQKINNDLNYETVYNSITAGMEEDEIGLFTYEADYDRYDCGDYVSIVANQYINLGDGRPQIRKRCYAIDAKNNATLSLADIFADKMNYKSKILEEINKYAKSQNIELIGGNGLSTISDTQSFYIKDKKLYIYFEASEIAATVVGELEFEMPFKMADGKFVF